MPDRMKGHSLAESVQVQRRGLADRLMQLMGQRSQRQWGRELGVPQQNISRYMLKDSTPHLDFLIHLARREHVNLNWLILGEGRMLRSR